MHCRGKFQFVPVSGSTNTAPPPPRITVTTQNTTPPPFWGPLPLRRPISISGVSQQRTSRHRHRLQQTEESAPAPTAVVAAPLALLFTGRRAASCVSPPRPRPTSPSSSRCGAAAWVHLSQTDGRNRGIIGMGEGENWSLQTERGTEGGRCMHLPPPPYLATPLSPLYHFGRRVCERASECGVTNRFAPLNEGELFTRCYLALLWHRCPGRRRETTRSRSTAAARTTGRYVFGSR